MIEAALSASVAILTAIIAVHAKLHSRIVEVDSRIDKVELRVAENYVPKNEFAGAIQKMEDHMVRIENKLDQMIMKNG